MWTKKKVRFNSLLIDCNTFYNHTLQNEQIFYQAQFATFLTKKKKNYPEIYKVNATLDNRNLKKELLYI